MIGRLARSQGVPALHIVRRPEQAALLKREGAQDVFDSTAPDFLQALKKAAHDRRATLALDAVGGPLTAILAEALPEKSEILVYGALGGSACAIDPADLIFKGQSLSGFWLTPSLRRMHPLIKAWRLARVQDLLGAELATQVQARLPIANIHAAIDLYKAHRTEGKVLLVFPTAA